MGPKNNKNVTFLLPTLLTMYLNMFSLGICKLVTLMEQYSYNCIYLQLDVFQQILEQ